MDSKDALIDELRAMVAMVAKQAEQIERLTRRIAELELQLAKAKKDSSTSSKPPSSDIVKPPVDRRPGKRRKRKRGGQPGHPRQLREPLPPERVDQTIEYQIQEEDVQRLGLIPTGDVEIIQHIELPDTPVHVTEHRLAVYRAADGSRYTPDIPELKGPIFGPRMLAMIGWLKSVGHGSDSTIETGMEIVGSAAEDRPTYDLSADYFRFLFADSVEPTHNHSEQQIRHCVIDRRITQGTRGELGQRYHERLWTAIATGKKQGRSLFTFLHESITAKLHNQPAPSLLNA